MTIGHILASAVIVTAFVGAIVYSKIPRAARGFVILAYLNLFTEAIAVLFAKMYGNNMVIFHLYVPLAAFIIALTYTKILDTNMRLLFWIVAFVSGVESFSVGFSIFNSFSFTVMNILVVAVTLLTYYRMSVGEIDKDLYYINGVMLFGAFSDIVFFFSASYLQRYDVELMASIFGIHSWVNMITYLLYALSLWMLSKSYSSVP